MLCGELVTGRIDKKFCSDACRSEYHNIRRREKQKALRKLNNILASNHGILEGMMCEGRSTVDSSELSSRGFNFGVCTASRHRLAHTVRYCYNYSYYQTRDGMVHISRIERKSIGGNDGTICK